jgi:hypothetical protein
MSSMVEITWLRTRTRTHRRTVLLDDEDVKEDKDLEMIIKDD